MPIFLWALKNWKLAAIVPLVLLVLLINHWRIKASQLDKAKEELSNCYDNATKVKELSLGYQEKITTVELRLAELKRVRPEKCVPISHATSGAVSASPAELPRQDGVSSGALRDFAADAQKVNERATLCKHYLEQFSN